MARTRLSMTRFYGRFIPLWQLATGSWISFECVIYWPNDWFGWRLLENLYFSRACHTESNLSKWTSEGLNQIRKLCTGMAHSSTWFVIPTYISIARISKTVFYGWRVIETPVLLLESRRLIVYIIKGASMARKPPLVQAQLYIICGNFEGGELTNVKSNQIPFN